ncbi:helix-turn-helix domain-containing protein [Kribbella sp. NPDC056951]|uniref:helix-turn-helix domain-containing protein n=1 Tax=Kribbella sp. NPDC056951 TaxID=3345978 RepID=UPI003630E86C
MPEHPLVAAIAPLIERLNAELVAPDEAHGDDIPLLWKGKPVVAVRLTPKPADGVQGLLAEVAEELGGPLNELSRTDKQQAVLLLEARGAFEYRKSAEIVAEALGVTRFTVYNYLNRAR